MSTSAEPAVRIETRSYDHPDAVALIAAIQAEYMVRYGGPDATPTDPAQFAPPNGVFLVGYLADQPVASGGWRTIAPGVAEIKRMFVAAGARRRGLARLVLAELERTAAQAGLREVWLETAAQQPEAIALYAREGYRAVTAFGHYRDAPESIHLGKRLDGSNER